MSNKGFTLIELLVVIAIVAVLSAAVIITLNPAELLRQTRDSNRISDMSTIKTAMALYLADVSTSTIADANAGARCYVSLRVGPAPASPNCGGRFGSGGVTSTSTTPDNVDGTGWVGNTTAVVGGGPTLSLITGGSPISAWPVDPTNSGLFYYAYAADNPSLTYELNANMESTKYSNTGTSDVESTDGGSDPAIYEVGTDSGLNL
ncbi:type II secretion system protein [Candidatus Parcubacteria bacterium]|nr:MAG: type II secretion system protein [Candidatus Parcubacteria bacterium]